MFSFCMGCMEPNNEGHSVCAACGYVDGTPVQEALHMEPGSILKERYIVGRVLGFGGFGVTYIGWDAVLEQKVAIKEYLPSEFSTRIPGQTQITVFKGAKEEQFLSGMAKFIEEAQRLAKFHRDDGIVRIFDSFTYNNTAYIIMEYLEGETLAEYIKRENIVPADTAITMLMPVIQSLKTVNEQGVIHRDVAPDNIFLTSDGKVKLIDFGAARFATTAHSRSLTVIIKPGYSPEEQYRSRGDQGGYTDVYAIGATLYRMITGITPPDALERRAHFESKKKDILKPVSRFSRDITVNQETAILNAINVRIEDRTPDMATLAKELTTTEPDKVKRLYGKISKVDLLRWPMWAKISTAAAMFAILFFSALLVFGVIGPTGDLQTEIDIPSNMARVPSVVNNDVDQAEDRMNSAALILVISGRNYSDVVPANLILSQSVNAGSVVAYNTLVEVTISTEAQEIIAGVVPDVQFMEEAVAQQLIAEVGFVAEVSHEYSDTVAYGLVFHQYPDAGAAMEDGGTVSIIVSKGSPAFAMPNTAGMSANEARAVLVDYGLLVSVNYEASGDVPSGYVIRQSVAPDVEVNRGDSVVITVSSDAELIEVADVGGMTAGEAADILRSMGFDVVLNEDESADVPEGRVISQYPGAGTSQVGGATVVITVSTGPPAVVATPQPPAGDAPSATPVPTPTPTPAPQLAQVANVVGATSNNAVSTLQNQGFTVSVQEAHNNTVASGNVISQSPAAGTSLAEGGAVTITVSLGAETVAVANVVGSARNSAVSSLEGQGLTVSVSYEYSATVQQGNVISQSPAAGQSVDPGRTISIIVSNGPEPRPISVTFSNFRADWGRDPNDMHPTYSFNYSVENGNNVTMVGIVITGTGEQVDTSGSGLTGSFQRRVNSNTEVGETVRWRAFVIVDGQRFYSETQETFRPGLVLGR